MSDNRAGSAEVVAARAVMALARHAGTSDSFVWHTTLLLQTHAMRHWRMPRAKKQRATGYTAGDGDHLYFEVLEL